MPSLPPKPCAHPGCRAYAFNGSKCAAHKKQTLKESDQLRPNSNARGYGYKWQKISKAFLLKHPLCECPECLAGAKQINQANVVDHIIDHKLKDAIKSGDQSRIDRALELFWDRSNWQAMAKLCHDRKTARENGGFGRGGG
jgi:5-methylcytosine-specific restriction enzyme A